MIIEHEARTIIEINSFIEEMKISKHRIININYNNGIYILFYFEYGAE